MKKRLMQLQDSDLQRQVSIPIGFGQTESGVLTDYYGSIDEESHAFIAVELDKNLIFFLQPNTQIEIID